MDTAEIRRRFVAHFAEDRTVGAHQAVPSAPLLLDDPNLLFVNAGMVPFKPYFLGQEAPPYDRAVSVQKCVRTPDIEDVGKTTRHGTFFEMCGNFSFGDYFKEGAIRLAWDLVTKSQADGGWGLEEGRLWPSILQGDDEALELWKRRDRDCRPSGSSARPQGELLVDGRARTGRPVLGDPLRPRLAATAPTAEFETTTRAGHAREARGPVPRVLEPGLHAGRALRGAVQGGLRHRRVAAQEEHRHRHGSRARRVPPPGQGEHVRDRRDAPRHREGLGDHRPPLRGEPRGRRADARGRRPRAQRDDADRGRGHPRQRGPRLRAAPAAAPRGPVHAAPRDRGPGAPRADARQPRQDGRDATPPCTPTGSGSRRSPTRRRTPSGRPSRRAPRSSTWPPPR